MCVRLQTVNAGTPGFMVGAAGLLGCGTWCGLTDCVRVSLALSLSLAITGTGSDGDRRQGLPVCPRDAASLYVSVLHTDCRQAAAHSTPALHCAADTNAADVYSFGIMLWCMVTGKQPFEEVKSVWEIPRLVIDEGLRPKPPARLPGPLAKLMTECWDATPLKRPSFAVRWREVEGPIGACLA